MVTSDGYKLNCVKSTIRRKADAGLRQGGVGEPYWSGATAKCWRFGKINTQLARPSRNVVAGHCPSRSPGRRYCFGRSLEYEIQRTLPLWQRDFSDDTPHFACAGKRRI